MFIRIVVPLDVWGFLVECVAADRDTRARGSESNAAFP